MEHINWKIWDCGHDGRHQHHVQKSSVSLSPCCVTVNALSLHPFSVYFSWMFSSKPLKLATKAPFAETDDQMQRLRLHDSTFSTQFVFCSSRHTGLLIIHSGVFFLIYCLFFCFSVLSHHRLRWEISSSLPEKSTHTAAFVIVLKMNWRMHKWFKVYLWIFIYLFFQ